MSAKSAKDTLRWLGDAFRWNLLAYGAVFLGWAIIYFLTPITWNAFWLLLAWAFVLLIHYLIIKSLTVDPDWAAQRSERITHNATDLDHITSIRERHNSRTAGEPDKPGLRDRHR